MRESFEAGYRQLFARHIPGAAIEILSWALLVTTDTARPPVSAQAEEARRAEAHRYAAGL